MKILVTGGLGFIGSNFTRYILSRSREYETVNLDNMSYGSNPANLKDIENLKRYRLVKGDITDYELVKRLVKDADAVVNLAAQSHVDRSIADPWPFYNSNTQGVITILEATRKSDKDIKFLQVGTDESYGDIAEGSFKEEDRLRPSSPYAASKAAADLFCLAYHRTYGLDVMITRCTNNFGPYQYPEKFIPKTIIRASLDLKIPVYGSGKNVRDWIYVLDHCEALEKVLKNGKRGETYNIAGGKELQNIQVVEAILELLNKPKDLVGFVQDRPGHDVRYSLNSSKIKEKLGWSPKYNFSKALSLTVNWYTQNEWWWKPLADKKTLHPTPWNLKW